MRNPSPESAMLAFAPLAPSSLRAVVPTVRICGHTAEARHAG